MNAENFNFFKVIKNCNSNKENFYFTLIDSGEKAVFSDGEAIFFTDKNGFFASLKNKNNKISELAALKETGVFKISDNNALVYSEKIGTAKKIIICGAGHVSMPIIRLAKMIGCHVTVIDDRQIFAENAKNAGADVVLCENFENALSKIYGDLNTFFVIVTRGHLYDVECLRAILKKSRAYVGMMGSKRRVGIVREKLINDCHDENDVKNIHSPIGLAISAETPEEIAVSIIAEIIQVKNQNKSAESFSFEILDYILSEKNQNEEKILCTIVSKKGAAPRRRHFV